MRVAFAFGLAVLTAPGTSAKEVGFHSPTGRTIYEPNERFGEMIDQNTRRFIVEVQVGAGPEGTVGLSLGYLFEGVPGFEL